MPTHNELAELYDSNKSRPGACNAKYNIHITSVLIDITCFALWASETRDSEAAYYSFQSHMWEWHLKSNHGNHRVLPVRDVK
jgi:hypothetical protein